ncbi:uncharacterized protein LOC142336949 [Convolutriloba macropyga]|uniref:uncharacterized protein LOC142336949 n=1 Tax=Convolutriloba macropyga TaxID=536237 RepID=UPI003F528AF5
METLVLIRISTLDLLGISTNALIFYLLFRHRTSSNGRPSDLFTLTISLVDILYILLADGLETISALGFVPEKWLRSMMHVPYYTFCLVPQLLLLCRTYCHYLAICNPFKFRQFVTRKNVSRCIIYAVLLSLLLSCLKSTHFVIDDHMKIAVAYFLFELIVLTAEFVLLVIFTAVCCWAILGIYCQKRREIREEIARMKKTSSGSVSQAGVVFRRHHHNMAHSMPTVIMGTSTCNSENLSSPNESRGTQSNVCFAVIHEESLQCSEKRGSIPHWSTIITNNNNNTCSDVNAIVDKHHNTPQSQCSKQSSKSTFSDSSEGGGVTYTKNQLPKVQLEPGMILPPLERMISNQEDKCQLPSADANKVKRGSIMGRFLLRKKSSTSPAAATTPRMDFKGSSKMVNKLSASTNAINVKWKQRKYIRIIVNLILIQLPFILLRIPQYLLENSHMLLKPNQTLKKGSDFNLNFIFQILHLSFYSFNAILAYMTSSQLRKLIKAWFHQRKKCAQNVCIKFRNAEQEV